MFQEEKCPRCGDDDYIIDDYFEDGTDSGTMREWTCHCSKCEAKFVITYYYTLEKISIEEDE